jgi:hypothetical protein
LIFLIVDDDLSSDIMEANKARDSKYIIIRGDVYLYNLLFVDDIIFDG